MAMCKAAQERRHIRSVVILTQDLADFRRRLAARHEFGKSLFAGYHAVFPYSACIRVGNSFTPQFGFAFSFGALALAASRAKSYSRGLDETAPVNRGGRTVSGNTPGPGSAHVNSQSLTISD